MLTVHRSGKVYGGEHLVYSSVDEARDNGIEPVAWREVEEGGWGISDDGYVAECVREYSFQYVFSAARVHKKAKDFILTEYANNWKELENGHFQYRNPPRPLKTSEKAAVDLYCGMLLVGEVNWHMIAKVAKRSGPRWAKKFILGSEQGRAMVDKTLRDALLRHGIGEDWVIQKLKRAVQLAEDAEDPGNMIRGVTKIGQYLQLEGKPTNTPSGEIGIAVSQISARFGQVLAGHERPQLQEPIADEEEGLEIGLPEQEKEFDETDHF